MLQVGALANRLFHAVRQIAKGFGDTFAGDRQKRPDRISVHDDGTVFCFQKKAFLRVLSVLRG